MRATLDVSQEARLAQALRIADDCLILGHRASEWCGHAPVLEEDIALANTALDLIGQCRMWYELAGEVEGADRTPDNFAYLRDAADFTNLLLVERPNGDFGRTLMRHFLFDAFHLPRLGALADSPDARVAEIAAKASKEARYHLDRHRDLVIRLGDGTDESHRRMQAALDDLWPYTGEMFKPTPEDEELAEAGLAPSSDALKATWTESVDAALKQATLTKPGECWMHEGGRQGRHTEHLGYILADMQFLQRAYPGAEW